MKQFFWGALVMITTVLVCWCTPAVGESCGDSVVSGDEQCELQGYGCDWNCQCMSGFIPAAPAGLDCIFVNASCPSYQFIYSWLTGTVEATDILPSSCWGSGLYGLFYSVYIVSPLPTAVELTTYSDNPIYLWLLEHLCDYDSITQAVCLKHTESRWTSQNHVAQIVLEPLLNHSYFVLISTPSTVLSAPIAFSLYTSSVVGSSNAIDDGLSSVALFFAITASIAIPIGGGIALFAGIHYYQKRKSRSSADTKYHALSSMGPPDDDKASPHSNMMEELWSNTNTNATATTNPTLPTSTSNPTLDNSTPAPTPNNAAPSTPPATQPVSLI